MKQKRSMHPPSNAVMEDSRPVSLGPIFNDRSETPLAFLVSIRDFRRQIGISSGIGSYTVKVTSIFPRKGEAWLSVTDASSVVTGDRVELVGTVGEDMDNDDSPGHYEKEHVDRQHRGFLMWASWIERLTINRTERKAQPTLLAAVHLEEDCKVDNGRDEDGDAGH